MDKLARFGDEAATSSEADDRLVPFSSAPSPVEVYLSRLTSQCSKDAMGESLVLIARLLLSKDAKEPVDARAVPWHQLRPEHVDALRAQLIGKYAPASVNRHLSALRGVIKALRRTNVIGPARAAALLDFENQKNNRPLAGRCLSMIEVGALFRSCNGYPNAQRDAAILALAYGAGMRRNEVAEAKIEDYDRDRGKIRICGKGRKIRDVPLPPPAQAHLNAWLSLRSGQSFLEKTVLSPAAPLVCRGEGCSFSEANVPLTGDGVHAALEGIGKRAGIATFSPHDLRRTFITELLARGTDPITTARMAGHSDVKTTMLYDRRPETVAQAAAVSLGTGVPMPLPTLEEMFNVANPRRDLSEGLADLRRYFKAGMVQLVEVALPALIDCAEPPLASFHGGSQHQTYCKIAYSWLRLTEQAPIKIEGPYFAGRFDLAVPDQGLYVECGDTPARKVITCCMEHCKLLLLPFETNPPRGFLFSRRSGSDTAWEAARAKELAPLRAAVELLDDDLG